jgi:hypothetical protein
LNKALKKKKRTRESKKQSQQQLGWVAPGRGIFSAQRQEEHQHKLEKKIWERSCRQARKAAGTHYRPALMEEFAAKEMVKSGAALDVPLELLG